MEELRDVKVEDLELLFGWANDPVVRRNSFSMEQIPFEDHQKWFQKLLNDPLQKQYIFMKDDEPIGQIRFSISNDTALIGYSIASNMRGHGYGKKMIEIAKVRFHTEYPEIKKLIAKVKEENIASAKCFYGCGFRMVAKQFEFDYTEQAAE